LLPPLTEILRRSMRYVHLFPTPRSSDKQCGHEKIVNSKPTLFSEIARHWRENKRREVSDRNLTITGARERACALFFWWAHCQNNSRKNIPNELREYVIRLNIWRHAIELSQSYSRIQLQSALIRYSIIHVSDNIAHAILVYSDKTWEKWGKAKRMTSVMQIVGWDRP